MSKAAPQECRNVCTEVTAHDLCIGCGACAGVCPTGTLRIEWNRWGRYEARDGGGVCNPACDLCLRVCPFSDQSADEDELGTAAFAGGPGMRHRPEAGYYLDAWVGYSNVAQHRKSGASGGLATWTLEALLQEGLVDQVACVRPRKGPGALFEFALCGSAEEVRKGSRSCYYPVQAADIVRHILSHEGRYAVTALPCLAKALRSAMRALPKLRRRIRFVLGLVCSQTKSAFYAEYGAALGGADPWNLNEIVFRMRDPRRPVFDYGMRFLSGDGTQRRIEGIVFATQGMTQTWVLRCFTPNACNFCDDAFAELADAAFMDANLPAFTKDNRGHTIVLLRSRQLSDLLRRAGRQKALTLEEIDIHRTIRSQQNLVGSKRGAVQERIRLAGHMGSKAPRKRAHLLRGVRLGHWQRQLAGITFLISLCSPGAWLRCGKDPARFRAAMRMLWWRAEALRALEQGFRRPRSIPATVIRKVRKAFSRVVSRKSAPATQP